MTDDGEDVDGKIYLCSDSRCGAKMMSFEDFVYNHTCLSDNNTHLISYFRP